MLVQHPDSHSKNKYVQLVKDHTVPTGDKLAGEFKLKDSDRKLWNRRDKQYIKAMRKLRVYAIKKVDPGHGSSIHYAGTVPFSDSRIDFRLSRDGRLHGTKNIFIADSSGFNFLPAKGLTFSLMANAHLTAENLLKS
jgi:hypothetical protein